VVFGHGFGPLSSLPAGTRSAQLHHGIGMKADVYDEDNFRMDVRFTEGPHYTEVLGRMFPRARLVEVGYPKVDPLFWPADERPRFDLEGVGLDPARPTIMYAPTAFPSSFDAMPDRWPEHFAEFNLIVKAHQFSYFKSRYASHRRKMARWGRASNVHVVPSSEFDPVPYFAVSDLLISDASSVLFEFAATDRPVVWCDFSKLGLQYRGPFRYRLERRMDRDIERYADICAHAPRYADLGRVVRDELAHPGRHGPKRREYTARLVGPTDGRASERIADHLLAPSVVPSEPRAERVTTAVILAAGMGTRLQEHGRFKPKGFLQVGGRPIVEQSIDKLFACGIERIVVVTGHCPEFYADLAKRIGDRVQLVHNDRYDDLGSFHSLYCARDLVAADDILLLESDLVYERRALERLLDLPDPDAVLLSGFSDAGDEIYVETREGRLVNMSKDRTELGPEIAGEFVGINKISRRLFARLMRIAADAEENNLRLDYETDGLVGACEEHAIACPCIDDLLWGEIDFGEHLERAIRIHPEIDAREGGYSSSPEPSDPSSGSSVSETELMQ